MHKRVLQSISHYGLNLCLIHMSWGKKGPLFTLACPPFPTSLAGTPASPVSSLLRLRAQNPWMLSSVCHHPDHSSKPTQKNLGHRHQLCGYDPSHNPTELHLISLSCHTCTLAESLHPMLSNHCPGQQDQAWAGCLQTSGLGCSEPDPHSQQPAPVSCIHGTLVVRRSHVPQAQCSMAEAEQGHSLPVCIFGNRTRIKLKEDDAHGL